MVLLQRCALTICAAFISIFTISLFHTAHAQPNDSYPNKPIRFIVPFAAGGASDVTSRLIAQVMGQSIGQSVIVENKAGAGGNIGTDFVAKAPPDGYTMLLAYTGPMAINPTLYKNLSFNPLKDFDAVTLVAEAPLLLGVNPSMPVHNVQELVAHLRDHPEQVFYGSSGTGGSDHLAGDLFMKETGTKIIHVPYKGGALALRDLVAGNTQMQFMTIPAAIPLIRDGRIRPLALLSSKRFELFPDVPTIAEAGLKDVYVNNTYGVTVPAGTAPDVIHKLNSELVKAVKNPEIVNRFKDLGLVPIYNTPAEFTQFMKDEYDRWAQIVQVSGASVD